MDNLAQSSLNCFGTAFLDRMSDVRRDEQWFVDQLFKPNTLFVPVWRGMNLFSKKNIHQPVFLDLASVKRMITDNFDSFIFLGMKDNRLYFAVDIQSNDSKVSDKFFDLGHFQDLKNVGALIDKQNGDLLIYAKGITYWHQNHLFCEKCGNPTASRESGHMRICINEKCKQQHFPRTDPAIIVLVTYGKKCLLARQPTWKTARYATIAGFVEPGESLEYAVVREVFEETGIHIDKVSYHSSQPWPFPCSIMLGFIAVANSYDIQIDGHEIEDAKWFSHSDVYLRIKEGTLFLPPKISISYNLIENWFNDGELGKLNDIMHPDNEW